MPGLTNYLDYLVTSVFICGRSYSYATPGLQSDEDRHLDLSNHGASHAGT